MSVLPTYITLRDRRSGRLYVDHACQVVTTSNPMEATTFANKTLARQCQESVFEEWGRRFQVIAMQVDYTYSLLREAP